VGGGRAAGARDSLNVDGYAIPINTALAVAARIDASAHGS
jgi:hypothetical protein